MSYDIDTTRATPVTASVCPLALSESSNGTIVDSRSRCERSAQQAEKVRSLRLFVARFEARVEAEESRRSAASRGRCRRARDPRNLRWRSSIRLGSLSVHPSYVAALRLDGVLDELSRTIASAHEFVPSRDYARHCGGKAETDVFAGLSAPAEAQNARPRSFARSNFRAPMSWPGCCWGEVRFVAEG